MKNVSSKYLAEVIKKFAPINGMGIDAHENIEEISENLLKNPNLIHIEEEGKGIIIGLLYPLFYNPNVIIAQELGWWVEPEYRNTSLGIKLLNKFEKEAKQRGAEKIIMFYLEEQSPQKVESMLQRKDYRHIEYNMVKDL